MVVENTENITTVKLKPKLAPQLTSLLGFTDHIWITLSGSRYHSIIETVMHCSHFKGGLADGEDLETKLYEE